MRICDLCKNNPASSEGQRFDSDIGGIHFTVSVWAGTPVGVKPPRQVDICPDCASKSALAVLGVNPTEPKKETP